MKEPEGEKDPREETPQKRPLELRPQPRATRLNRLVLAVIGLGAIAVLWIGSWALGRRPGANVEVRPPRQSGRPLDVERLRRAAPRPPETARAARPPLPPPPPVARPARAPARSDPEAVRAQRAVDASPLVPAFANSAFYPSGSAERGRGPATADAASASSPFDALPVQQGAAPASPPEDPGLKDLKAEFLATAASREIVPAPTAVVRPQRSDFVLWEGTLVPAILKAGILSDLPGQTQALVRANVYDSRSGRHLLVPSGTVALGRYDHRVAWGQKRVLIAWHRLLFPDGSSLDLGGMPGADLAGQAGLRDRVDNHFVRIFGSALMLSAFSAGAQLSQPQDSSTFGQTPSARQVVAAALGQELNRTATMLLRRNLQIEPTLVVRPGYEFTIQLTADLVLPHAYQPRAP